MQNIEKDEYLYRSTHGNTSLYCWKPKIQPTHSPPFFYQPKQPLNQFYQQKKKPKHTHFFICYGAFCSCIRPRNPCIFTLPWKQSSEEAKTPCPTMSVYEKEKAHVISWNTQLAVYPQTKALGRMKGKLECLLKLLRGPLAELQIAFLLSTTQL